MDKRSEEQSGGVKTPRHTNRLGWERTQLQHSDVTTLTALVGRSLKDSRIYCYYYALYPLCFLASSTSGLGHLNSNILVLGNLV